MRQPQADDLVRLISDLPEMFLRAGCTGVVCSTWFMPHPVYEVEFQSPTGAISIRALIFSDNLRVIDEFLSPKEA
ncbi:MAG: DUF4926 domain-containing protein [Tepidisphaeraceae bacterium]|jgi:hypothetical protein